MSKHKTPAEEQYLARVAALRCVLCRRLEQPQNGKTDVHHFRHGEGMAQRSQHWLAIALCHFSCHEGPKGIHGDRSRLRVLKADEVDLLAWTIQDLNEAKEYA